MATDYLGPVIFHDLVTFAGGMSPEIELANIDSLDISGNLIAAGAGQFGTDVSVGDDLTVTDDASIGGLLTVGETLAVTGAVSLLSTLEVGGALSALSSLAALSAAVTNNATVGGTLGVTGAVTLSSTLAAGATTITGALGAGATTLSSTLAVAGASELHNTTIIGTLGVSSTAAVTGAATFGSTVGITGATTAAAISCTTMAASSNATVGGTLGITGVTTAAALSSTTLTASTSLVTTGATIVGLHEHVSLRIEALDGTAVYGIPSPVAGTITKIQTRLDAPLATGNATITGKIGAVDITTGVITITEAGSAAGDIDVCNPSGANTVIVGSNVNFTVGGTNNAAVGATMVVTFLRSA